MHKNKYVQINEDNLRDNIENIISNYNEYNYYFGVVKGNGYSHGMHIVNALIDGGINYLAVFSLEEALVVRKYNRDIPILCFGYVNMSDINIAIENNITITIVSYDYFKQLIKLKVKNGLKVHLKINTGMNRFGLDDKEKIKEIVDYLDHCNIYLEGIYTHYATSGVFDIYWDKQTKAFENLTSLIDLRKIPIVHAYDSLSLAKHKKIPYFNGVRLGIVMYGYSSSAPIPKGVRSIIFQMRKYIKTKGKKISPTILHNNLSLKKAFNVYSEVLNITNIKKGDIVGYNATYVSKQNCKVATIAIGYGDGITKYYKHVKINNRLYPIVAICMDVIMVIVDDNVKIQDKVTVIGDGINISDIAVRSKLTVNQVLLSISSRIPRVHVYNGDKSEIKY